MNGSWNLPLACADFTFPLLSHDEALDLIAMLQFEGVDIGLFEGRSHLHPSDQWQRPNAGEALRQRVRERGLKVADVFLQIDSDFAECAINHPEVARREKAREWFFRTLEYAAACQSPHVTILPGVEFDDSSAGDAKQRCYDELAWRVEQAEAAGLILGVEAHVGSIAPTPEEALSLVEAVDGLTLTLDYTHFTRDGLPDNRVEPLVPHASHFHARAARPGRLQCAWNHNAIDYGRIVEVMRRVGYQGYLGVEYVWIDWEHCNEVDNLSETILLRDFLRSQLRPDSPANPSR